MPKSATKPASTAAKPVLSTMPASLLAALPAAKDILFHAVQIERMVPQLRKELEKSHAHGAVQLARSFVVLHRLIERLDETLKPLSHDNPEKPGLFEEYKRKLLPELFEAEGVKSIPLAEGFRVGVSVQIRASIKKDMKSKAHEWLRENKLADIITSTVNASTLSAVASDLLENQNKELPEELFNVAPMATTSVTKT